MGFNSLDYNLMQQNKEQKQQYLREEILEPGYDVEDFIEFLSTLELGHDIDQISFKQLKETVETYCKRKAEEAISTTKACMQVGFDSNSILKEEKKQSTLIKFDKYGLLEPELTKVFRCKKIQQQKMNGNRLRIEVNAPERRSVGGFFGIGKTSFWAFEIVTHSKKWNVKRRYSDFVWIRNILLKFFPTYIIPALPKKKASKKSAEDIEKRMKILAYFLNDIVRLPEVLSLRFLQGFLSIQSDSQFQKLKKQGTNAQAFEAIVSLETPNGLVTVSLSEEQKLFHEEFLTFASTAQTLYKSINANARNLQTHILEETNTLYTMGNQFADLYSSLKAFNVRLPQLAQTSLSNTYARLNHMMIEWGNIVKNQHSFIQKSFLPFFRYARHELYSVKELSSKVLQCQQEYFKSRIALEKRKEKIFQQNDINKWEIHPSDLATIPLSAVKNKTQAFEYMLPQSTIQLDKLRLNYAFYSSQFQDQSEDMLQNRSQKFNQNFKQFAINIKVNTQQLAGMWTEVATNFADPHRKMEVRRTEINESQIGLGMKEEDNLQ